MELKKSCLDCVHGFGLCGPDVVGKSCDYLKSIEIKLPGYASKYLPEYNMVAEFRNTMGDKLSTYISPKQPYVECEAHRQAIK